MDMITLEKTTKIRRAISAVRLKAASIPTVTEADEKAVQAAERRVRSELQREFGAKIWFGSDGNYHLYLAKVMASSEGGYSRLLRTWQLCAGRKIIMLKVIAA